MLRFVVALVLAVVTTGSVWAQTVGDAQRGLELAREDCSECHLVEPPSDPNQDSPAASFLVIANTPGMNELALRVWFQTPHKNMPNFILSEREKAHLIAYISSLRTSN